ncbi:HAMP domain-containing histidine kinase [bacterium]|nr:HAMP domain-containing histidine kinase [bacterium]
MTLTNRLLFFFLATLACVLLSFSIGLFGIARIYLHGQAKEQLEAALNTLIAMVEIKEDRVEFESHDRILTIGTQAFENHLFWFVQDDAGRVVSRSSKSEYSNQLADDLEEGGATRGPTLTYVNGQAWLVETRSVQPLNPASPRMKSRAAIDGLENEFPSLLLTAAVPLKYVQLALWQLAATLLLLTAGLLMVFGAIGGIVCRRAIRPLRQITGIVRRMTSANLYERLSPLGSKDELDDLVQSFNGLLDRLEVSFEQQKQFTGDASHQLRTPLTVIRGQAEVALRRDRTAEDYRETLLKIQRKAEYLEQITESLLFLARADADVADPQIESIDLRHWLPEYLASRSNQDRVNDIIFKCELLTPALVVSHPALLGELLGIILDNAIDYSNSGTLIRIQLYRENDTLLIGIDDQGIGIDPADLQRVFAPFFRSSAALKRNKSGVGLGLSIAHRIANSLGIKILAQRKVDQGSIFVLMLRRRDASSVPSAFVENRKNGNPNGQDQHDA